MAFTKQDALDMLAEHCDIQSPAEPGEGPVAAAAREHQDAIDSLDAARMIIRGYFDSVLAEIRAKKAQETT